MLRMKNKDQAVIASWINVLAGTWLVISPFVLKYTGTAAGSNDVWLGLGIAIVALIRAFTPSTTSYLSWINILSGVWMIIAPFVLGYVHSAPIVNDIVLGLVVLGTAIWNAEAGSMAERRMHARA